MTEKRLYELAHSAALANWAKEKDFLEKHPENSIAKHWEAKHWAELMEIENEMRAKGYGYSNEK